MGLDKIYRERLKNIVVLNSKDLERLLAHDERCFYFYLMNAYLSHKDLSEVLRDVSNAICVAITLFCYATGSQNVKSYFGKYINIDESVVQVKKIYAEEAMFDKI